MKVLVIPEDFRKDQYMLLPLCEALFRNLGKPSSKVVICKDPLLGGIDQALRWDQINSIIERYKAMVDVFLLLVDRDGNRNRRSALDALEQQAKAVLGNDKVFIAENAWQELEVWVLAGHDLPSDWVWREVRQDFHPKETYYLPFAKMKGVLDQPAEGRKTLAQEASRRMDRIRSLCSEDIASLETRLREFLEI